MIQPLKIVRKEDNDAKIAQIIKENIPANQVTSADDINAMVAKINEIVPAINVSNGGFQGQLAINEKRVDSGFYIPTESGTFINADNVVVDLSQGINFVTYDGDKWDVAVVPIVADGKVEEGNVGFVNGNSVRLKFKDLEDKSQDFYPISETVYQNGNTAKLTAINDTPALISGYIENIKGYFPTQGNLSLFIAKKNEDGVNFTVIKKFSVDILSVGENTINIRDLNIEINKGEYLGVNTNSTSKPFYGVDKTLGYGWYQNQIEYEEDKIYKPTYVENAVFAISYNIVEYIFQLKNNAIDKSVVYSELDKKVNIEEVFVYDKPYEIPSVPFNYAKSSLSAYVAANKSGNIVTIKIAAKEEGKMLFQIFERKTFNIKKAGDKDTFIPVSTFEVTNIEVGYKLYKLPVPIEIKRGQYLVAINSKDFLEVPLYQGGKIQKHEGWLQISSFGPYQLDYPIEMVFQPFSVGFEFEIIGDVFQRIGSSESEPKEIIYNDIYVKSEDFNHNKVRDILESIKNNSYYNRYCIYVSEGIFYESDIKGKQYVEIIGKGIDKTILRFDFNIMSEWLSGANYSMSQYSKTPYKDIPQSYRHTVFVDQYFSAKYLNIEAIDAKYPIHIDKSSVRDVICNNMKIKAEKCNYPIGVGTWGKTNILFKDIIVEVKENGKKGVFVHNRNNQENGSTFRIENGKFVNCAYLMYDELGSDQVDQVEFINCFTTVENGGNIELMVDKHTTGGTYYIKPDGEREMNPTLVPYCMFLNFTGTRVDNITSKDSGSFNLEWNGLPQRDIAKVLDISIIKP
ncbi:MAG TPA: hypothetical protein VIG40_03135 [Tissierellaceae bacterium]